MRNRIKECRKEAGMTQGELGKAINADRRVIYRWESGIVEPRIKAWEQLANALNVSPTYLVGWTDENDKTNNADVVTDQSELLNKAMAHISKKRQLTEEKLHKEYAGGVVITLTDGKKLYDHASIDDIYNCECDGLLCGEDNLVPIRNVECVEMIRSTL